MRRNGHPFISDGYANARILEYTADGKKVREFGTPGTGPGEFRLPHSIQIDENNIIYVADRENGRVQRFDMQGKYLGEWAQYGKTFGLKLDKDTVWLSTQPRDLPNLSPGWLIQVDRKTGKLVSYVESEGNHGMDIMVSGEPIQGRDRIMVPQLYRREMILFRSRTIGHSHESVCKMVSFSYSYLGIAPRNINLGISKSTIYIADSCNLRVRDRKTRILKESLSSD